MDEVLCGAGVERRQQKRYLAGSGCGYDRRRHSHSIARASAAALKQKGMDEKVGVVEELEAIVELEEENEVERDVV